MIGRVYDMEARQDLTAGACCSSSIPICWPAGAARRDDSEAEAQGAWSGKTCGRQPAPQKVTLAGLPENGAIRWGPA
jgi:thiol:disulfide interchange protein DsbC